MKKLSLLLTIAFFTTCIHIVKASNKPDAERYVVIGDLIFRKTPPSAKVSEMIFFTAPYGKKATILKITDSLPEEELRMAIPVDSIPDGPIFLHMLKEYRDTRVAARSGESIKVGDKFPVFKAIDLDGNTWSNKDIEGKVMVLNLWFSGCGPCRAEMPELSEWKKTIPDVMFFASTYEDPETVRYVLDRTEFNWIQLVQDTQFFKWTGTKGYPLTLIVDKSGIVSHVEYGTSSAKREALRQKILELL